jgi:hypothetical protein
MTDREKETTGCSDEHAGLVALAVIGGIVCAALLGWGLVHPILVLNHAARLAARADRAIESIVDLHSDDNWERSLFDGSIREGFNWGAYLRPDKVTIEIGYFDWFDTAAYGAGLMPDGSSWDLKTVVEALSDE